MPSAKAASSVPSTKVTSTKKYLHEINPDDPAYKQELLRPAVIKEDVKLMDARQRVSLILKSDALRRELESIVKQQLRSGPFQDTWAALHQLGEVYVPQAQYGPALSSVFSKGSLMPALPINDVTASTSLSNNDKFYPVSERILRCKVASLFRLIDIFGWASVGFNSNITMRINVKNESENNEYLINPLGLLFHEISASSLSRIKENGDLLDAGATGLDIDRHCWSIHRAIHMARDDIRCVIHLKTSATIAISSMDCGLLPLSQEAMIVGKAAIYDPKSFSNNFGDQEDQECDAISRVLGDHCRLLLVKNFGLFVCTPTIEEGWHYAFNAMSACQTQMNLLPVGIDKIHIPSERVQDSVYNQASTDGSLGVDMSKEKYVIGELEFQALMRQLDQVGYRTGYFYRPIEESDVHMAEEEVERKDRKLPPRENLILSPVPRVAEDGGEYDTDNRLDIEIPPLKSSVAEKEDDSGSRFLSSSLSGTRGSTPYCRGGGATTPFWLNTPNSYVRELLNEVGSPIPKTYTHWEEGGLVSASEMIENPNQFAPQGCNPKEFSNQQKVLKSKYLNDEKQSGPTSKLLENVTDEEAIKLQEAREGRLPGDHVIVVGAVSKAIIKKEFRHNAAIYQSVYATNPFNNVTEKDINSYEIKVGTKKASSSDDLLQQIEEEIMVTSSTPVKASPTSQIDETAGAGPSNAGLTATLTTSGAEVSFTDTDVDTGEGREKKKKKSRRFKMPSFSKKSHQHSKQSNK